MYRYSEDFRLAVVQDFLSGDSYYEAVAKRHGIDRGTVRRWVDAYRLHGAASVKPKYSHYSAAFKLSVLQRMRRDRLSYREVAALFDIRNFGAIGIWERKYDEGGLEALSRPSRRPRTMQKPPKPTPPLHRQPEDEGKRGVMAVLH